VANTAEAAIALVVYSPLIFRDQKFSLAKQELILINLSSAKTTHKKDLVSAHNVPNEQPLLG
jgi:hypothetical protein